MQRCLRWQVSRTRRAGEAVLPRQPIGSAVRASAGVAGTARWRKCGPAAQRRANGVAYSADIRASGLLRRLPEVLPRGLRRLWDGAPCPITLAQFPARQHLAGKIRFSGPALYYNYPLFTRSDAPFGSTTAPGRLRWPHTSGGYGRDGREDRSAFAMSPRARRPLLTGTSAVAPSLIGRR